MPLISWAAASSPLRIPPRWIPPRRVSSMGVPRAAIEGAVKFPGLLWELPGDPSRLILGICALVRPIASDFSTFLALADATPHLLLGRLWVPCSAISGGPAVMGVAGAIATDGIARGIFRRPPSGPGGAPPHGNSPFSLRQLGDPGVVSTGIRRRDQPRGIRRFSRRRGIRRVNPPFSVRRIPHRNSPRENPPRGTSPPPITPLIHPNKIRNATHLYSLRPMFAHILGGH